MRQILKSYATEPVHVDYAIRILDAFEQADQEKAALPELVRIAGSLANRLVGVSSPDGFTVAEHSPAHLTTAHELESGASSGVMRKDFGPRDRPLGTAWMQNASHEDAYQVLILDRLAAQAEMALLRSTSPLEDDGAAHPPLSKAATKVATVIGTGATAAQRIRAAAQLGFLAQDEIVVLVIELPSPNATSQLPADWPQLLRAGRDTVLLARRAEAASVLPGTLRCGVGRAVRIADAAESLESAELALQFTTATGPGRRHYRAEDLGGLLHLATVPSAVLARDRDIGNVETIAAATGGPDAVALLEEIVWSRSLRSVASTLNYHHSSITQRVNRLEAALGLSLAEPAGRLRAQSALLGWRQLDNRRRREHG